MPAGPDQQSFTGSVIDLLSATPGVDAVRRITDDEVATMLEPWLGAEISTLDLPMPVLIDATVRRGHAIDIEALSTRLMAVAPGTVVDEHAVWLRRLTDLAAIAATVSLSVMVLVLFSAVMTVVFTTRTGLAIHSDVVEVLHLIGAKDSYIARQFQIHTLWLAGIGAACGSVLGGAAILLIRGLRRASEQWIAPRYHAWWYSMGPALPATGCGGSSSRRDRRNYGQTRSGKNDVKHGGFAAACRSCGCLSWPCRWVFCLGGGFYRFAQLIPEPTPRSEVATDAIVVLTGGTRRVSEGLSLLERGFGKKLFVSGVTEGSTFRNC